MFFKNTLAALTAASALFSTVKADDLPPIEIVGNKFFSLTMVLSFT